MSGIECKYCVLCPDYPLLEKRIGSDCQLIAAFVLLEQ